MEPTKFKLLNDCQFDIEKLKKFIDILYMIISTYDQWIIVPWKKIDCEYYL